MSTVTGGVAAARPTATPGARPPEIRAAAQSSGGFIWRFTVQRARLGVLLFSFFVVVESLVQGIGIAKAYPDPMQRAKIIDTFSTNPALSMFYGDRHQDIVSPAGYMTYRILPILVLIGAVWMATFVNKMLRGQEETGRWELLLSGQASARRATVKTLLGALSAIALVYIIVAVAMAAGGKNQQLHFGVGGALLYGLVAVSGAVFALGVAGIASQLAATKRKANLYALLTVAGLWVISAVSNAVESLEWLKNITPFGWAEKLHPFSHPRLVWLAPIVALALIGCGCSVWLAGRRDMGESLVKDAGTAKPHFGLLRSQWGFGFRASRGVTAGWLAVAVAFAAIIAAVDKTVGKSLGSDSGSLSKTFSNLSGNPSAHIEIAYLGAGAYILVTLLMVMVTTGLGAIREEESSSRLENFVSGTVARRKWLVVRLALLMLAVGVVTFTSNTVLWAIVAAQGVHVRAASLLGGGFSLVGPVALLLGMGVLLYGIKPRLAVAYMYVVVAWSFTADILSSILHMNHYLADTSLLRHIALVPAAGPNWGTVAIMTACGLLLAIMGVSAFQRRDLALE